MMKDNSEAHNENYIIESNRLIAEFMQLRIDAKGVKHGKEYKYYYDHEHLQDLEALPDYHEKWDWLMPVVDKINGRMDKDDNFELTLTITPNECFTYSRSAKDEIVQNEHGNSTIQMVYIAVVNTIKWIYENTHQDIVDENDGDVYIECPHCEHCESHPIDEQRHHLQTFEILDWLPDEENKPEVSVMKCLGCHKQFRLTWNYNEE